MKKFILLCSIMFAHLAPAQVGIGNDTPDQKSMLDIVSPNNDKGILIPRITEAQRDAISVENAQNGLMVYNTTEDCFNYWNLIESVWSSICGKAGKAVFTLDCSSVSVNGTYLNNVALTSDNKLLVTVNVTKAGSYTISASSTPDNKYFFTKSGDFLSTGKYTIEIPGYGTPENFTADGGTGDLFSLKLNGVASTPACTFNVKVQDSSVKPEFRMDCGTAVVKGTYQKDKQLDNTNYIEVTIRFDASVNGAPLRIRTNEVDGISFDSGDLKLDSAGQATGWVYQKVTLYGSGAPISFDPKLMTITSNSSSSTTTCSVKVVVGFPKLKLYGTGVNAYNVSGSAQLGLMINSQRNFGMLDNSVIKFQGWTSIVSGGASASSPSAAQLTTDLLGTNPPDIVVFGYPYTVGRAAGEVIKSYLEKGGVVLCYMEGLTDTQNFLRGIFGESVSAGYSGSAGSVYKYREVEDPVLNGPFGDLRGQSWGEDASSTQGVTGLDSDFVIYSMDNTGVVTSFRSKKYNFIFAGDGGFNSSLSSSNSTSATSYPFWTSLSPDYIPVTKSGYGNSSVGGAVNIISNSIFTANAFAWAIEMASLNGINLHN
ncbi:hypothetical protein [Apibacter sp. HY039]|uniref:hypothetical protein n=1 Tax=Apibacter sp. HY039 TaxID=2501476 RepID=UPI000FEC077E|nr:hypothetical protein [Apibacter sp. HY039]